MTESIGKPNLRYLDAGNIEDDRIDFDGLDVRNAAGEKLGTVEGFILQRDSNRPYYVVVDSGGWFSSRHYLVPVGHVRFDQDNEALRMDIDRDTISRFPEVHLDRFDEISADEAARINEGTLRVLAPNEVAGRTGDWSDYDRWSHYHQPDWWHAEASAEVPPPLTNRPLAEDYDPNLAREDASVAGYRSEEIVARRDEDFDTRGVRRDDFPIRDDRPGDSAVDTPLEDKVDRAQPGDVLGIETAGETTGLGDTAHDEDDRRGDAEKTNRELLEEQRKNRKK